MDTRCAGAKVALFIGGDLVALLRDDVPDIAFPDHWDLPGGFADHGEGSVACACRETREETGIKLAPEDLKFQAVYSRPVGPVVFFAAYLPTHAGARLRLGDEGQRLELMTPQGFIDHPRAVPHLQDWLRTCLGK